MGTQIAATRTSKSGRRGPMGRLGKRGLIGVAVVAVIIAAVISSQTLTHQASTSQVNTTSESAPGPSVSSAQYYDDLMSQQEHYIQTMGTRAMMRQAAAQYDDLMTQQDDFLHTMAARADARLLMPSEQERTLEDSTTAASTVPYYRTIDGETYYDRLTGQTASASVATAARQCTHPVVGFPTCFSLQADGTWAREEMADVDSGWIVVATVTYNEMKDAIGEVNASGG